jgi:hypothetical protein
LIKFGIIGNAMHKARKLALYQNKKLIIYVKEEDSVDNGGREQTLILMMETVMQGVEYSS